jgi:hypothetical protein
MRSDWRRRVLALDDLLDIAVGAAMVRLVGWHWVFLPSFLGKLIQLFDEIPCLDIGGIVRSRRTRQVAIGLESGRNPQREHPIGLAAASGWNPTMSAIILALCRLLSASMYMARS